MASSSRDAIARISGPAAMAKPGSAASSSQPNNAQQQQAQSSTGDVPLKKKKKHRAGRKRRNRRQSFVAPSEAPTEDTTAGERPSLLDAQRASASQQASFYRLQNAARSNTSLESEALLDHRDHGPARSRRETLKSGFARVAMPFSSRHGGAAQHRSSDASNGGVGRSSGLQHSNGRPSRHAGAISEDEEDLDANDKTPLLGRSTRTLRPETSRHNSASGYGSRGGHARKASKSSRASSRPRGLEVLTHARNTLPEEAHDVNNPPSMPGSPVVGAVDDPFMAGLGSMGSDRGREAVISIDGDSINSRRASRRRATVAELAERDVCFPADGDDVSEACVDEEHHERHSSSTRRHRRRRAWPDLEVLEEWSREEKEERTHQDLLRAKKISEPVMVGGRLRPAKTAWHRGEEEEPFRFTYFNETLDGTIHARTIADLQDDMTFKELFLPDPIELSDSESDDEEAATGEENSILRPSINHHHRASSDSKITRNTDLLSTNGDVAPSVPPSIRAGSIAGKNDSAPVSGRATPKPAANKRHGPRPTFWLDVLKPTETEMKVLSKAFGIHQLTAEDILMDEPREKVELFHSYYFVNYRTFEQDKDSEDYMEPINMYVIVFRDGVISFHHSMSPHPANVRRRIRQLNDYMSPTADWVSYAIIDDITDVYGPLVSEIEQEVDIIDEDILYMHTTAADNADQSGVKQKPQPRQVKDSRSQSKQERSNSLKVAEEEKTPESGGDLLRRVGESRKKVMGLYRLLGNKADVIKGFAKRCNEHWEVAPRSEIGLYLGDIQDHIVTMTGNLAHYESYVSSPPPSLSFLTNLRCE